MASDDPRVWRSRPYSGGRLSLGSTEVPRKYELKYQAANLPYDITFDLDFTELRSLHEWLSTELRYQVNRGKRASAT